jgi:class 3 adenylate cyclase
MSPWSVLEDHFSIVTLVRVDLHAAGGVVLGSARVDWQNGASRAYYGRIICGTSTPLASALLEWVIGDSMMYASGGGGGGGRNANTSSSNSGSSSGSSGSGHGSANTRPRCPPVVRVPRSARIATERGFGWHILAVERVTSGDCGVVSSVCHWWRPPGQAVFVVHQTDVTDVIQHDIGLERLTSAMLPRHAIDALLPAGVGRGGHAWTTRSHHASSSCSPIPRFSSSSTARSHVAVTVMFLDVVGFTSMAGSVRPHEVMAFLNDLFSGLDDLLFVHRVQKVDTAGDCYIIAAGVLDGAPRRPATNPIRRSATFPGSKETTAEYAGGVEDTTIGELSTVHDPIASAMSVLAFARDAIQHAASIKMPHDQSPTRIRVGVHTGPIVSGIISHRLPTFGLFGDTMNVASRMEQTSPHGSIQVSDTTYALVEEEPSFFFVPTGGVHVKGKGFMLTHTWTPPMA